MNKQQLLKAIISELENVHQTAKAAAHRAYETATDEENEAENKYDTLGLEASYLAHGQSKRVTECEADLIKFRKLTTAEHLAESPISIGNLVCIEDEYGLEKHIFLSPVAGGLTICFMRKEITLITPSSPIGKALTGCFIDDEIILNMGSTRKHYQITTVY